jgi:hypothetical protein
MSNLGHRAAQEGPGSRRKLFPFSLRQGRSGTSRALGLFGLTSTLSRLPGPRVLAESGGDLGQNQLGQERVALRFDELPAQLPKLVYLQGLEVRPKFPGCPSWIRSRTARTSAPTCRLEKSTGIPVAAIRMPKHESWAHV